MSSSGPQGDETPTLDEGPTCDDEISSPSGLAAEEEPSFKKPKDPAGPGQTSTPLPKEREKESGYETSLSSGKNVSLDARIRAIEIDRLRDSASTDNGNDNSSTSASGSPYWRPFDETSPRAVNSQTPSQEDDRASSSSLYQMGGSVASDSYCSPSNPSLGGGSSTGARSDPISPPNPCLPFEFEDAMANYRQAKPFQRGDEEPRRGYDSDDRSEDGDGSESWVAPNTDDQRAMQAVAEFGNAEIANPDRCLTFSGYRRTIAARESGFAHEYATGLDAEDATRIRLENGAIHCLDLKENRDSVEIAVGKKRRRESGFDKDMEDLQAAKRRRLSGGGVLGLQQGGGEGEEGLDETMSFDEFKDGMIDVLFRTKKPAWMFHDGAMRDGGQASVRTEWKYFMNHFKAAENELEKFADYYKKGRMTKSDLESFECTEMCFQRYPEVYGRVPQDVCKECTQQEGKEIKHRL